MNGGSFVVRNCVSHIPEISLVPMLLSPIDGRNIAKYLNKFYKIRKLFRAFYKVIMKSETAKFNILRKALRACGYKSDRRSKTEQKIPNKKNQ